MSCLYAFAAGWWRLVCSYSPAPGSNAVALAPVPDVVVVAVPAAVVAPLAVVSAAAFAQKLLPLVELKRYPRLSPHLSLIENVWD